VLAGEQTIDEIVLNPLSWYAEHGITLHTGKPRGGGRPRARVVVADDGTRGPVRPAAAGHRLHPFILPVPGKDLPA
jgi:nitrite reductase (NADH) large subunit